MLHAASATVGSAAASNSEGLADVFKREFNRVFPECEYKSVFFPQLLVSFSF